MAFGGRFDALAYCEDTGYGKIDPGTKGDGETNITLIASANAPIGISRLTASRGK